MMKLSGFELETLQDGFKAQVLAVLNLVLLLAVVFVMPIDVPGKAAGYEQTAADQAKSAQHQAQIAKEQADAASAAAQVVIQRKNDLSLILPDPTWASLCPKTSSEVARLIGGIVDRWVQVPGDKIGWEYRQGVTDNTVTLKAPSFGRLESSFSGIAKPGSTLNPSSDYHYYFWCDS